MTTFLHLQWIVSSYRQRAEKIARYDPQSANAGSWWAPYYLVEDNAPALATAYRVENPEFLALSRVLGERFPNAKKLDPGPNR